MNLINLHSLTNNIIVKLSTLIFRIILDDYFTLSLKSILIKLNIQTLMNTATKN